MNISLSILLALAALALPAQAWNHVGHRTVAELAWRQLSPKQRDAASELLRHHPHYEEMLAADVPAGVGRCRESQLRRFWYAGILTLRLRVEFMNGWPGVLLTHGQ